MNTRTPLVLAASAAALAAAGCASTAAAPATAAPGPTTASTGSGPTASATPAPTTTAAASSAPSARPSAVKPRPGTGCPVSEATLLRALRSSAVARFLAPTDTLTGITCYDGYALGLTHPREADDAEVVFHYTGGAWHAVNGGTAYYCDGVVPASVRAHLKHC